MQKEMHMVQKHANALSDGDNKGKGTGIFFRYL